MEARKGVRLGHKLVKIWKRITARSKRTEYVPLRSERSGRIRRHCFRIPNRLRRGHGIWGLRPLNSQGLTRPKCFHSKGCTPLFSSSEAFSPRHGMESGLVHSHEPNALCSQSQCFQSPHFQRRSLHFPHIPRHWHVSPDFHHNSGKKMGIQRLYQSGNTGHVPKGCLAVYVGQGEEHHRFVIPVIDFNHPLFGKLLKEAEEEYGFDQKGTITLPCEVADFEYVQKLIHTKHSQKQYCGR